MEHLKDLMELRRRLPDLPSTPTVEIEILGITGITFFLLTEDEVNSIGDVMLQKLIKENKSNA